MSENRLLVCVSASSTSADLVRRAGELARTFGLEWIAVHVQNMSADSSSDENRARAAEHLQLAEQLGARVEVLSGGDVASTIVDYALHEHVTRIVIGKRAGRGLRRSLQRSIAARLLERSGTIDVYVVQGTSEPIRTDRTPSSARRSWLQTIVSVLAVIVATALSRYFQTGTVGSVNIVMIYLVTAFAVSIFFGWLQGLITSVLAVLAFNFFFTAPYYTLVVYDPQYLVTFAVMLIVTLVSSWLAARVRSQAESSRDRERRTRALYDLSRKLTEATGEKQVCDIARGELAKLFGGDVKVVSSQSVHDVDDKDAREAALWCIDHGQPAGIGTENLTESNALCLPLHGRGTVLGVVIIEPSESVRTKLADNRSLIDGMASLVAFALEREEASIKARNRLIEVENEKMRNALLRGISHDLRTPLATIAGSSTALLHGHLDREETNNLITAIAAETQWMSRVVENMLHATRLEAGGLQLSIQPETVDDLVTSAVARVSKQLSNREPSSGELPIIASLPQELVVVPMDLALMEQVLINLLDNALRYAPVGSPVSVRVDPGENRVEIIVEDEGPGVSMEEQAHIFEKFYRGEASRNTRGSGLGLWISEAIVKAHHGTIHVENRRERGARFCVSLAAAKSE